MVFLSKIKHCLTKPFYLIITGLLVIMVHGCTLPTVPWTGAEIKANKLELKNLPQKKEDAADYSMWENRIYRSRDPLPTNPNRNEGSLWESGASWGNFFRDQKARFKGDIVQINNLESGVAFTSNDEEEAKLIEEIRQIESQIETLVAEVTRVLPNGNVALYGQEIIFQQGDDIRFVTTVKGYARVVDINDDNTIDADKIYNLDVKTTKGIKKSRQIAFYNENTDQVDNNAEETSASTPAENTASKPAQNSSVEQADAQNATNSPATSQTAPEGAQQ